MGSEKAAASTTQQNPPITNEIEEAKIDHCAELMVRKTLKCLLIGTVGGLFIPRAFGKFKWLSIGMTAGFLLGSGIQECKTFFVKNSFSDIGIRIDVDSPQQQQQQK